MKLCFACGKKFGGADWKCPACSHVPEIKDGFISFAGTPLEPGEAFDGSHFSKLAEVESDNFWFKSRNKLITWAIKSHFPGRRNFFEIGCGTGFVLSGIKNAFPGMSLRGADIHTKGLDYSKRRLGEIELIHMDARRIPFEGEFDLIGIFDVIEHIEEDESVLSGIHRALSAAGGLIITVPQHKFLWGRYDEQNCHVRRYSAAELKERVAAAGFRVIDTVSFVSILFPLMAASRLSRKFSRKNYDSIDELRFSGLANAVLRKVMTIEHFLIRCGMRFPFGGSLLLIARKEDR
ncbi:MAG: methyltransferase domain-containing protein [Candidatus Omnitrophota bacterium]|nr:methyltransferase domain-containing protein [Candidatus Omnitrophota bacterium]